MRHTFHLKTLAVAVATLSVASVASAAGLDRSGQDITAFLPVKIPQVIRSMTSQSLMIFSVMA